MYGFELTEAEARQANDTCDDDCKIQEVIQQVLTARRIDASVASRIPLGLSYVDDSVLKDSGVSPDTWLCGIGVLAMPPTSMNAFSALQQLHQAGACWYMWCT